MPKVADVKISWKKSPSIDIDSVTLDVLFSDGSTTSTEAKNIEEFMCEMPANSSINYKITVKDLEGKEAVVQRFFAVGDLEDVLPVTDLTAEIVNIHEAGEHPVPSGRSRKSKD